MYSEVTAVCGCKVGVDVDVYAEGCCEVCVSSTAEVTEVVIMEACIDHS